MEDYQDIVGGEQSEGMPKPEPELTASAKKPRRRGWAGGCLLFMIGFFVFSLLLVVVVGIGMIAFGLLGSLGSVGGLAGTAYRPYVERYYSGDSSASNKLAVIDIRGIILSEIGAWGQVASAEMICDQLRQAADDPGVKAVILRINSPGGEVTAADRIHHEIMRVRANSGKPVIAVMESLAASGGLYVAVAADHIVAHRMTTTGSIGVIAQTFNYHQLMQKIGLEAEVYKSGTMKDLLSGSRPRTQAERELMQEIIMDIYDEFVSIVAAGRESLSEDDIRNSILGDGRVFSGRQAYSEGLVDQLGFFEDGVFQAAAMAGVGEDYRVVLYQRPFVFSDVFAQMRGGGEKKLSIELPGTKSWLGLLEPGKCYLLPSGW